MKRRPTPHAKHKRSQHPVHNWTRRKAAAHHRNRCGRCGSLWQWKARARRWPVVLHVYRLPHATHIAARHGLTFDPLTWAVEQ